MDNKRSIFCIALGILFLLNAFFGRYIVLPGYLAGLEQGQATLDSAGQTVPVWIVVRYLIWAYSFKLGMFFVLLGAVLHTRMPAARKWAIAIGGLLYIAVAYIPLPAPASIVFGLAGGLMLLMMIYTFLRWAGERDRLPEPLRARSDYRTAGYFFFAMATYTLCPLLGVKTFALAPEKMIQYGLQPEAASFAFHVLIELVLAWFFIALSLRGVAAPVTTAERPQTGLILE